MKVASSPVWRHLARGVIGLGALAFAASFARANVLWPLLLVPVGLLALRGCPMCWLMGLHDALARRPTTVCAIAPPTKPTV